MWLFSIIEHNCVLVERRYKIKNRSLHERKYKLIRHRNIYHKKAWLYKGLFHNMKCLEAISGDMENLAWQITRFAMPDWKSYTSAMSDLQRQEPRLIAGARLVIDHLNEVLHSTDQSLGRKNRCAKVPTRRDSN